MAKNLKRRELVRLSDSVLRAESAKERLRYALTHTEAELRAFYGTGKEGLSDAAAAANRERFGSNVLPSAKRKGVLRRLAGAFVNPFTAILFALALVSVFTDIVFAAAGERNYVTVAVIAVMVAVSGILRFVQETRSGNAAEKLSSLITTTACVCRAGAGRGEIPVSELVAGDIVHLSAGDMIPADLRILAAKDLFVAQSALTGESAPVEKTAERVSGETAPLAAACLAFLGTNVVSGSGTGIVIAVGADTFLGQTAKALNVRPEKTAFEKGVTSVSHLLIRFMLVMVPLVLLLNGFTKGDWLSAVLFAVSVAVGLTPEMLPMIVTACLAKGAVALSRRNVIVKDLNAIQNLGAMDILCTDKTGTLTQDKVVLEYHLNVAGELDARVLRHAFLNSNYQTGLKNLMDIAVIERTGELVKTGEIDAAVLSSYRKTDEIPFDFERRRMSVVVEDAGGKKQLITKGAVEEMLAVCTHAELRGSVLPLSEALKKQVRDRSDSLNRSGMRVLCVAQKNAPLEECSAADEAEMVLIGYLAFLDPPKASAAEALKRLKESGVAVKVLTGDNEKVTACVCGKVGLDGGSILLGADLEEMNDETLAEAAERATVFAKLSPTQKERVVRVLRAKGHTVGFMGDGINDAPAMRAADVGISVDTAVDIAKESAGVILLKKDLTVVADGVAEGRKTYVNMIKYIKITASSNFGNMLSVLAASAFLPFLPMLSVQLILLNLVYDISCTAMPWDSVDKKLLAKPAVWDARSITKFMLCFGPISSLFDIATYLMLYFWICPSVCGAPFHAIADPSVQNRFVALFQAGWFVESAVTQMLVVHMLRGERLPLCGDRPSALLIAFSVGGIAALAAMPYTPIGEAIGLCPLPLLYYAALFAVLAGYMLLTTFIKRLYRKRNGSLL